jgi:hypothetical protein
MKVDTLPCFQGMCKVEMPLLLLPEEDDGVDVCDLGVAMGVEGS